MFKVVHQMCVDTAKYPNKNVRSSIMFTAFTWNKYTSTKARV